MEHNVFDLENIVQLEIRMGFHDRLTMNVGFCELYFPRHFSIHARKKKSFEVWS
jgi:hypothetical protein